MRLKSFAVALLAGFVFAAPAQGAEPAQERAVNIALMRAKKVGTVENVSVTATTLEHAMDKTASIAPLGAASIAPPGALGEPSDAVEVVTATGRFVDSEASVPPGDPFPAGTEMTFTIDKATGFVLIEHIGGDKLATAVAARVKAKVASRHPRAHTAAYFCYPVHCYSVADWNMVPRGEAVEGTSDVVRTSWMNVPGWNSGDFVNQEGWTVFPGKRDVWLEAGTKAGYYMDCCHLHGFWEQSFSESNFTTATASWTFCCSYKYDWIAAGSGVWYGYWDEALLGGFSGLETYSRDVQAGMEMQVASGIKPEAAAEIDTAGRWTTGSWHSWTLETGRRVDPGTCFSNRGIPGYISVGTC